MSKGRRRAQLTQQTALATIGAGGILDHIGQNFETDQKLQVQYIQIEQIMPNPFQPRQDFDKEALQELSESIKRHGFYGHLLVRQRGRKFQLVYGERRLRAAKLAGLKEVPTQIKQLSDHEMNEIALTENIQREDLNPIEEAFAYARMKEDLGNSIRVIAERVGKSKSYIATLLSLLRYKDIQEAVRNADIPIRTAEELAKEEDSTKRAEFLRLVLEGKINRNGIIEARKGKNLKQTEEQSLPSAKSSRSLNNLRTLARKLQKEALEELTENEKEEALSLLKQIKDQGQELLRKLQY